VDEQRMNDQRLETMLGRLLQAGVLLAAAVVFAGGVVYLVQHAGTRVDFRHFAARPGVPRTFRGIFHSAAAFESEGLIQLGLLLLIATPVARVAMAVVGFFMERDWLYVSVSVIVLLVLVFSLMRAV
jgi:uncharacterized membrane protein